MDGKTLTDLFRKAAHDNGYESANAVLASHADLKVSWVRTGDFIHMGVSDYLLALSPEAASELATGLLNRIHGATDGNPYTERVSREISSEDFARANQSTYIERHGLDAEPAAWTEYQRMAKEQGVVIPEMMRVFAYPMEPDERHVSASMRVAIMPTFVACAEDRKEALAWIERAAVEIGKGHEGIHADAPDHYVSLEVARMDQSTLREQFIKAAHDYGYVDADADVVEMASLKIKWERTSDWIFIHVPDYLLALSPEAAYELAKGLLQRLSGIYPPDAYTERVYEELSSEAYAVVNQGRFIERNHLSSEPEAWRDYLALATEQGAVLPTGMKVYLDPPGSDVGVASSMRVAAMPAEIAEDPKTALQWIEDAAVCIGKGILQYRGDAPDHYVRLDRGINRYR